MSPGNLAAVTAARSAVTAI